MKQRILTGIVLVISLIVVFFFYHTFLFHLVVSLLAAAAVYELLWVTGYLKDRMLLILSVAYAFVVPFFATLPASRFPVYVTLGYFSIMFALLLIRHEQLPFQSITTAFFISLAVPFGFTTLILIRSFEHNIFYTILIVIGAWICDTGAYFTGRAFGKHKLAPKLSPNKTIEGAVGGTITTMVVFLLATFVYQWIQKRFFAQTVMFSVFYVMILGLVCAVVGMIGDLMASLIKRQCGIKDYGKLMPGHSGIMDRFDSMLLVAPVLYLIVSLYPIF